MAQMNPYEPPVDLGENVAVGSYRREGDYLLVSDGAVLPRRCIRTNVMIDDGDVTSPKKLAWCPAWMGTLTFSGGVIALAFAVALRKRFTLSYCLTAKENSRLRNLRWIGWMNLGVGLLNLTLGGAFLVDGATTFPGGVLFSGIALLFSGSALVVCGTPLRAVGYPNGWFRVKGCSRKFLDSIDPA